MLSVSSYYKRTVALYAGSFDPISNGHLWIVRQALKNFDHVVLAIGVNPDKKTTFTVEERKDMIEKSLLNLPVSVEIVEKQFIANYCRDNQIKTMIRGIRNVKDLEYEQSIQAINERINSSLQTIYFIPPSELAGVSSSMVKSLINESEWQFVVKDLVPEVVMQDLMILKYKKAASNMFYSFMLNGLGISPESYTSACIKWEKKLLTEYSSPKRYYHNWQHILEMYNCGNQQWNGDFVAAILFHDVVYDVNAKNNEERSAQLFEECVGEIMSSFPDLNKKPHLDEELVKKLILTTQNHQGSMNEKINAFIDADLFIFAESKKRVFEYERQIRQEYIHVPDNIYKTERIKILQSFLNRPYVYLTSFVAESPML